MAARDRYTAEQLISAIQGTFGIKTAAAKTLECNRQTITNYIERYPTVARAYHEERERLVDMAESKFAQAIHDGEWQAVRFALVTLGKDRGYYEKRELEHSGVQISLSWDDAESETDTSEAA